MAIDLEVRESLFNALQAVWSGDAQKLGGTPNGVDQGVVMFERWHTDRLVPNSAPTILVEITAENDDPAVGTTTYRISGRLNLFVNKRLALATGSSRGEANMILAEIRRLYDDVELSTTDWVFARTALGGMLEAQSPIESMTRHVVPFFTVATKGTTRRRLLDTQGSGTWTAGSSGIPAIAVTEVQIIDLDGPGVDVLEDTELGEDAETYTAFGVVGRAVRFVVEVTDDTPSRVTIPAGEQGTLTVWKDRTTVGAGKVGFGVLLSKRGHRLSKGNGTQRYVYTGVITGEWEETA